MGGNRLDFQFGQDYCDIVTNNYYLELNGASYKLVTADSINYYTMPDQHFKITRSTNTWNVYDKDGNFYQFGGTADSQQYIGGTLLRYLLPLGYELDA